MPTSNFIKRAAFTRDSDSSSKYQTPQKYLNAPSFSKTLGPSNRLNSSSIQDSNEIFRQEVVEQVKVRVEELQSKMKSKSDMFYVIRHMCKKCFV